MTEWCILRTSPGRTLAVEQSLVDAGLPAWTPKAVEMHRTGRGRKKEPRDIAVLPGIVFAVSDNLLRLVTISKSCGMIYRTWDKEKQRMVAHEHPPFSVFRHLDSYPLVRDRDLDPLRRADRRPVQKEKPRVFGQGEVVRCPDGGFQGLTGVVQNSRGQYAVVLFDGHQLPVQISSRLLLAAA